MMELAEKLGFWSRAGALRLVMGALCAVIGWAFLLTAVLREGAHRNNIYHSTFGYTRIFYYDR